MLLESLTVHCVGTGGGGSILNASEVQVWSTRVSARAMGSFPTDIHCDDNDTGCDVK